MKFNILAGYLLALTLVGFFLWIIRGVVRGLRQKDQLPSELPDSLRESVPGQETEVSDKIPVDWSFNLLYHNDDIEYPGRLEALTPGGAFLRCSAPLRVGQMVSLYFDVPDDEICRVSAKVLWVGKGMGQRPATQVRFEGMAAGEKARMMKAAGGTVQGRPGGSPAGEAAPRPYV